MSKKLPKIKHPIFELELPSTGEKVKYRTFTVKEEKILLIAQESKDYDQAILSIKQVVNNCLIGKKIEDLAMFDLEFVLLTIRSKSVNNLISFKIKDEDTSEEVDIELDLDKVQVVRNPAHTNKIELEDNMILMMRYPTIDEFGIIVKNGASNQEANFEVLLKCMDKLIAGEEVYIFKEFSEEELLEFFDDLDAGPINKIKQFFETMPVLRHEIKYTNNAGTEKTFVIEGMETFFI